MKRLYGVLNVKIGPQKWPKRAILAVFWTFLKGPSVEFAQTALKCSFSHACFNGAIGSNDTFRRGLARIKMRSASDITSHISHEGSLIELDGLARHTFHRKMEHFGRFLKSRNFGGAVCQSAWGRATADRSKRGIRLLGALC